MIWINCIFGLLIFNAITCSPEISHAKSIRIQRGIPGGDVDKDPNDPKYYDLANLAIRKYAQGSYQTYLVLQVTKATEQTVAGLVTNIDFYAVRTLCPYSNCQSNESYNLLSCHARIFEQSWLGTKDISVYCDQ